ncbi:response regulator [Lujinxingia vulgaris]|uniref:Response regulator n=1 Tax=Lujinxingia vulgaris TaxID=2600176 RepID=A0A5C6X9Q3_9DELT|nr:response regulator [Lujinxingia vulgaris]TXD34752.1 response regulator [Lujinxingia vulgaris]
MARVLIVEDSPLIVQMLTMVCQGAGHDVVACERFGEVGEVAGQGFDVVITDLNLPEVPGDDTVRALREIGGLASLPVIIVSGRPRAELEQIAAERGAQGALSKDDGMPVIAAELPPMIASLIG